jgi:hypothetical protein
MKSGVSKQGKKSVSLIGSAWEAAVTFRTCCSLLKSLGPLSQ